MNKITRKSKDHFKPVDVLLVRTPALPVEFQRHPEVIKQFEPISDLALAISTPSLFKQRNKADKGKKVRDRLDRYKKRFTSRPTPYGLCAGVGLAKFGDYTNLSRTTSIKTSTRVDMSWIMALINNLESDPIIRNELVWWNNPEVAVRGERLWLDRSTSASIKASPPVMRSLALTSNGLSLKTLTDRILREFRVSRSTVEKLCAELCEKGVLISELRMPLNVVNPLTYMLEILSKIPAAEPIFHRLATLEEQLRNWDTSDQNPDGYLDLCEQVKLIAKSDSNQYVQVDSLIELPGFDLCHTVGEEMSRAAELCCRFAQKRDSLAPFKRQFRQRYEIGTEVPILELCDNTFGLGSPYKPTTSVIGSSDTRQRDKHLFDIALGAYKNQDLIVEFGEEDINILCEYPQNIDTALPPSMDIFFSIAADSREDIDQGRFHLIISPRGGDVTGGRALGRFANMLGSDAIETMRSLNNFDKAGCPNYIFADINFSSLHARSVNVALAPSVREYSIVSGCLPPAGQINIPLSEIVVGLDNDVLYARSIKTGQRVIARSNNLLNVRLLPEPIQLLLDIGLQGCMMPSSFSWGAAEWLPFLPRVVIGKTIYSLAKWDLQQLRASKTIGDFRQALAVWKTELNVPDLVMYSSLLPSDNWLNLDLSSEKDVEQLFGLLAETKEGRPVLQEYISTDAWHDVDGLHYATEFVGFLGRADLFEDSIDRPAVESRGSNISQYRVDERLKTPGSDWLYFGICCGTALQERVLSDIKNGLIDRLESDKLVEEWFFVRYVDEKEHLRLRLHVNPDRVFQECLPAVCTKLAELVRLGLCNEFSIETYSREIERYGGDVGLLICESIFCLDSRLITELFRVKAMKDLSAYCIAALSMKAIIDSFEMPYEEVLKILETKHLSNGIKKETSGIYRVVKEDLRMLLLGELESELVIPYFMVLQSTSAFSKQLAPLARALHELETSRRLDRQISEIVSSILHMHCNRLLGVDFKAEAISRRLLLNAWRSLKNYSVKDREVA